MIETPAANTWLRASSWRKLDLPRPRSADAPAKGRADDDATRGSNSTPAFGRAWCGSNSAGDGAGRRGGRSSRRDRGRRGVRDCATHGRAACPRLSGDHSADKCSRSRVGTVRTPRRRQRGASKRRAGRAPLELVTPATASAACSAVSARAQQRSGSGSCRRRLQRRKLARGAAVVGREGGIFVFRSLGGHRHRPLDHRRRALRRRDRTRRPS